MLKWCSGLLLSVCIFFKSFLTSCLGTNPFLFFTKQDLSRTQFSPHSTVEQRLISTFPTRTRMFSSNRFLNPTSSRSPMPPAHGYFFDLGANLGLCSFGLIQRTKTFCHLFEANARLTALLKILFLVSRFVFRY